MRRFLTSVVVVAALAFTSAAQAQFFAYQGKLTDGGAPAAGPLDLDFLLFDAVSGGIQIGGTQSIPGFNGFAADGTFVVDLDFGGGAFNGTSRWLEVWVDGAPLSPRQPVLPAPYAIYSYNGGTNGWTDKGPITHTMDSVGIGTTTPAFPLHIQATQPYVQYTDTQGGSEWITGVNGGGVGFNIEEIGAGPRLVINEGGNVGIGTTDPQHSLHVNGILRVGGTTVGIGGANGDYLYIQPNSTGLASFTFHQEKLRFVNAYGEIMRLFRGGDVSIGSTSSPGARLGITRTDSGTVLRTSGSGSGTGINVSNSSIGVQVNGLATTGTAFHVPSITGSARAASFYGNSSSPMITSWNDGTGLALQVRGPNDASPAGGGIFVSGDTAGANIVLDNNEIMARNNGAASTLYLNHQGGNVAIGAASGGTTVLSTPVLQITGGADFSEMFDVGGAEAIEPGTVVVIDPDHPGRLIPSTSAYDAKVAGIISGAGGVATGMRMGHDGTIADGEHPVALSGRVYCFVDATEHGVRPGDMLTTSDTPGHAMRVIDRDRAQGAVIGKAMTSLDQGETGLVLVLVTLQ